jgi:hypothetical protein
MNKTQRILSIIFAVLVIAGCLTSCGEKEIEPRMPLINTMESADNSAGMRFVITLDELDELLEDMMLRLSRKGLELGGDDEWHILTEGLVDDNGVGYTSYEKRMNNAVLTVAVEDESKKLINVGCGCPSEILKDNRKKDFITLTAALADCVGGYHWNDLEFVKTLTGDFLDGKDGMMYYEGLLFTLSEDEESVVVILSPSDLSTAKEKDAKIYQIPGTEGSEAPSAGEE